MSFNPVQIGVISAGAWGTALAIVANRAGEYRPHQDRLPFAGGEAKAAADRNRLAIQGVHYLVVESNIEERRDEHRNEVHDGEIGYSKRANSLDGLVAIMPIALAAAIGTAGRVNAITHGFPMFAGGVAVARGLECDRHHKEHGHHTGADGCDNREQQELLVPAHDVDRAF